MQSLIRSKSAGVTGGRGTAGAGPGRDLLYNAQKLAATLGHILRMRNCGIARYFFYSTRYMLSNARNDHYRARYAVFKRRNP